MLLTLYPHLLCSKPFMYAVDNGMSLWSPPLNGYSDGKGQRLGGERCSNGTLACWFQPLSNCEFVEHHAELCQGRNIDDPRKCVTKIVAENKTLQM